MKRIYSNYEIHSLAVMAYEMQLQGTYLLDDLDKVEAVANGIGPEWLPIFFRKLISEHNSLFEAAALIHDMRYEIGGKVIERKLADIEFFYNCCLLIKNSRDNCLKKFVWYWRAVLLYWCLRVGGFWAWR